MFGFIACGLLPIHDTKNAVVHAVKACAKLPACPVITLHNLVAKRSLPFGVSNVACDALKAVSYIFGAVAAPIVGVLDPKSTLPLHSALGLANEEIAFLNETTQRFAAEKVVCQHKDEDCREFAQEALEKSVLIKLFAEEASDWDEAVPSIAAIQVLEDQLSVALSELEIHVQNYSISNEEAQPFPVLINQYLDLIAEMKSKLSKIHQIKRETFDIVANKPAYVLSLLGRVSDNRGFLKKWCNFLSFGYFFRSP
jgi:hypothetical protein